MKPIMPFSRTTDSRVAASWLHRIICQVSGARLRDWRGHGCRLPVHLHVFQNALYEPIHREMLRIFRVFLESSPYSAPSVSNLRNLHRQIIAIPSLEG